MPQNQIGYTSREELISEMQLRLADNIIDVELDSEHYHTAIDLAFRRYRALSQNATEESMMFLQTEEGVVEYTLPNEVIEVTRLYRRGVGSTSGGGTNFDPFDVAFNNMYLLNAGQIGGIATFDAFSQYKETIGRVFGSEYNYIWNRNTHVLKILRNVNVNEEVGIGVFNFVPEEILLTDIYASPWLADYSLAEAKGILGEAYRKFGSLPGAGGGIALKGDALKAESREDIDKLLESIRNMEEGNAPLGFIIG